MLTLYEQLEQLADDLGIHIRRMKIHGLKGAAMTIDGVTGIVVAPKISEPEAVVTLAEELGHVMTSVGDSATGKMDGRTEERALRRAADLLLPDPVMERVLEDHLENIWEISETLGLTETFVRFALQNYLRKVGSPYA